MVECTSCNELWPEDRFNRDCSSPDWCFRCRSKTLQVAFAGGREMFHGQTTKEFNEQQVAEARKNGLDPVPIDTGGAWNAGSASSLKKIGEVSKKVGAFGGKPASSTEGQG